MKFYILFILLLTILNAHADDPSCSLIPNDDRVDCYPEYGSNEKDCINRGCCWRPPSANIKREKIRSGVKLDVPYCYYPTSFPSYEIVSGGLSGNNYIYSLQKNQSGFRPNEILKLEASIILDTDKRLRVQIVDPNNERYQVPILNNRDYTKNKATVKDTDYQISISRNPFSIKVFRKSTGRLIFDTSAGPLIYADQYIEFTTSLVNTYFYGIGEHRDNLAHTAKWNGFTLWNRDVAPTVNTNLYGTHPFYLSIDQDGNAMGFYLLNSNGMDINVSPKPALTFITIGGILDFYIYMGPTPQDVVMQHTEIVGRSILPQYFTLGFNLCRWKYNNSTRLREIIERNRAAGMYYDTQWTDIDAMSLRMDWTYDTSNFSGLPDIVKDLHDHGQHYVNIIDPAISNTQGYYPYESGLKNDVFIKPLNSDEPLVGIVWPGQTVFPDFTNPKALTWWADLAKTYHDIVPFDGIWIDMNEPSNFLDGSLYGCTNSTYDNPPYTPKVFGAMLASRTVCPSARQYVSNHYNLHNMYGHFEAFATHFALHSINYNKRPFILTRSSFAGTGQFSAHWSGDNRAFWDDLYYSIPNMLNFNMFGVSQVGSDICGFSGDTTEELCIRWMQLGSFYPFMRNHNDDISEDQDPAAFSLFAQEAMKKTLKIRYTLLPYLYTLFYKSNAYGETVVRPLFFEFTSDLSTHFVDKQFMFGPAFLISPVLEQGATFVNAYFPNETWYRYDNGELVEQFGNIKLDAPLDFINVHLRGGYVVPFQHASTTTTASRKNPFGLLIGLKSDQANGTLFWDDGESIDSVTNLKYNSFDFVVKDGSLKITRTNAGYNGTMILSDVKVYGVAKQPQKVTINDKSYDNFIYDDIYNVLKIQYFYIDMNSFDSINISWA